MVFRRVESLIPGEKPSYEPSEHETLAQVGVCRGCHRESPVSLHHCFSKECLELILQVNSAQQNKNILNATFTQIITLQRQQREA